MFAHPSFCISVVCICCITYFGWIWCCLLQYELHNLFIYVVLALKLDNKINVFLIQAWKRKVLDWSRGQPQISSPGPTRLDDKGEGSVMPFN